LHDIGPKLSTINDYLAVSTNMMQSITDTTKTKKGQGPKTPVLSKPIAGIEPAIQPYHS